MEKSEKEAKRDIEKGEDEVKKEKVAMTALKEMVYNTTIDCNNFRKRTTNMLTKAAIAPFLSERKRISAPGDEDEILVVNRNGKKCRRKTSAASVRLMNAWITNKTIKTSTLVKQSTVEHSTQKK